MSSVDGSKFEDKDHGWDDFVEGIEEMSGDTHVKIGFPEGNSAPGDRGMSETAFIASIHEYGAPNHDPPISARPFIRPTIDQFQERYFQALFDFLVDVLEGQKSLEQAFALVGERAAGDIKKAMRSFIAPKLSEAYVENDPYKQGSRRATLRRQGWMRKAVGYEVEGT